jgi:tetratricopeptide (TPR) repeat protein
MPVCRRLLFMPALLVLAACSAQFYQHGARSDSTPPPLFDHLGTYQQTITMTSPQAQFTEPPPWYYPVSQSLGAVLLQAGQATEAEEVYREDLRRNPASGWSLYGLAQSLRAQDRPAEASVIELRFQRAWSRADVTLKASRF